jgi:hypothetical protein
MFSSTIRYIKLATILLVYIQMLYNDIHILFIVFLLFDFFADFVGFYLFLHFVFKGFSVVLKVSELI